MQYLACPLLERKGKIVNANQQHAIHAIYHLLKL